MANISNTVKNPFSITSSGGTLPKAGGLVPAPTQSNIGSGISISPTGGVLPKTVGTTQSPATAGLLSTLPKIAPQTPPAPAPGGIAGGISIGSTGNVQNGANTSSGTGNPTAPVGQYASTSYYNPNASMQGSGQSSIPTNTPTQTQGLFPSVAASLANFNTNANPQVSQAQGGLQNAIGNLKDFEKNTAQQVTDQEGRAIPIQFVQGRQQAINRQAASTEAALQGAVSQNQAAVGQAQTSAGQQLQGLQSAASATAPQLGPVGTQGYYDPITGLPSSGASANTPFGGGVAQGNVSLGQQYAQNVSAFNQGTAVKNTISQYLASNPTLNPSAFTDVNSVIQLLNGKVSNPQYQTLSNYLQEYVNTLAPILGVGGDTTNLKTEIANGFVNAHQSGASISSVLDGIESLAKAKLSAQQGGSNAAAPTSGSSVPTGSGLYSF